MAVMVVQARLQLFLEAALPMLAAVVAGQMQALELLEPAVLAVVVAAILPEQPTRAVAAVVVLEIPQAGQAAPAS
jgi:hypothetical protein